MLEKLQRQRWKCLHKNEWENASKTSLIVEKTVMVIAQIFVCWVRGDMAECTHVIFISLEWEMRAEKRETIQVQSALLQKCSLKINIEIRPPADTQQDLLNFYAYIVYVK